MQCCEKTLYHNGRIVTLDAGDRTAEAVLTAGGRIEAVGGAAELRRLGGPRLKETDLGGLVVYPGFIDTHSHPAAHLHPCGLRQQPHVRPAGHSPGPAFGQSGRGL